MRTPETNRELRAYETGGSPECPQYLVVGFLTHAIRTVATQPTVTLVPQPGIEPSFDAYKATVIPIYYKGENLGAG